MKTTSGGMSFSEWKARALVVLGFVLGKVQDQDLRNQIEHLIHRLTDLRRRDIVGWLRDALVIARSYPEISGQLLELIPTEEQIELWFRRRE